MLNESKSPRRTVRCVIPAVLVGASLWCGGYLAVRYHRGWPVYAVGAAGAATAGLGLLRSRWRGLDRIRELELQHSLELERTRIAKDLHDSLGADLTKIALLADMALRVPPDHSAPLPQLHRIATLARDLVDGISELVWATNPRHDTLDGLAAYLREYSSAMFETTNLQCRFDFPKEIAPHPISGEARRHVFLALKEVLNNIVKHAEATEMALEFKHVDHHLQVVIADNGRGFAMSNLASPILDSPFHVAPCPTPATQPLGSGNGLRNLRERMLAIGGELRIESTPGQGTRVYLSAPVGVRAAPIPHTSHCA